MSFSVNKHIKKTYLCKAILFTSQPHSTMRLFISKNTIQKIFLLSFFAFTNVHSYAQDTDEEEKVPLIRIDSLYREDQFFFAFTYNTLQQKPTDLSQNKFSTGFSAGILRDMPINKDRTVAIATGLGITYNNYIQNLAITGGSNNAVYTVNTGDYSTNKFSQLMIDVPVEFRWRTSTYESHKFWRIYGGLKFSYLLHDRSVFTDATTNAVITNNKDFNKFLYGLYASAGYNTINVYVYYGLNSMFKTAAIADKSIDMKALNVGLIFYIL